MIETVNFTENVELSDELNDPVPLHILKVVERELKNRGYTVTIVRECMIPEHSDSLVSEGTGRTPKFMSDDSDVSEVIRTGVAFPFSVKEEISGYFGKSEGSSNVTTFFVRDDMKIPEVIEKFHVTGQIERSIAKVENFCEPGVDPVNVVAFAIATYAKGWLAEKILGTLDRFSKGSVSQDKGGLDLYDRKEEKWRQVKNVSHRVKDDKILYYQWDMRGGLHFGEEHTPVNKHAGEVSGRVVPYTGEITPTETLVIHSTNKDDDNDNFRYLWW